ncbi:MAG: proteasome assembly chaperone family protein [Candidatus Bathyarchaeota archaeon]|nr:proteasome assembly chaperone family protein [Candidatus Bathyarchaeota archaeon]MDH4291715.1 proteasome assembly chaperone family protein [Dehalococcoidia bacterium]MDH5418779.1 proteasome assembly chaperone family protein [Candidatus Bathyarchaeota archaeon]MDH5624018.1 proteasome assembly chaperone family protein [Candidatus Bathyarchaeota archaeon]MDH5635965.1 proteasome assembly chaperone family protein [Candidatus Bathyarchaeota archaeon]
MSELVKIVEKKPIPSGATMLYGLPDVGLVGLIATSYLISELDSEEIAYMDSDLLPPVVVLHDGLPHAPLRIYGNKNFIAVISELAIPTRALNMVMRKLVDWGQAKKVKMMVSMGGIPIENRQVIAEPKVYGAASTKELLDMLSKKGLSTLNEGYMVGPQALTMRYCAEKKIPAIALLAQSFYNYPDPEAAAMVLKELSKITETKIDVSKLLEKGEEIRLKARDIMKRTQQEMTHMKKSQEYDLPLYV